MRYFLQKICGEVPQWVKVMINIQYNDCEIHSDAKDNRLDRFCINCVGSFCNQCSSNHEGHTHIKVLYDLTDIKTIFMRRIKYICCFLLFRKQRLKRTHEQIQIYLNQDFNQQAIG